MTALVRVVLVDPSHPGNIGSVARAMKNMGLNDLVLVRPKSFPHPDAVALAAGADDVLAAARVTDSLADALADCGFVAGTTSRARSLTWDIETPRDVAARIAALPGESRAALLFGSERYGLQNQELESCQVLVRIPANPAYCSLNLAMSVQLLSYELLLAREQPRSRTEAEAPPAEAGEIEHLYRHLERVLAAVEFEDRTGYLMERLRRLFNRARLDKNEVNLLRGILNAVEGRREREAKRRERAQGGA